MPAINCVQEDCYIFFQFLKDIKGTSGILVFFSMDKIRLGCHFIVNTQKITN